MEHEGPSQPHWVLVRNCVTINEAFVLRSVLEASGIECFLPDESLLGMRPELSLAIGGARVLVPSDQLDSASELLNSLPDSTTEAQEETDD